jgi:hypothetical protein
MKTLADVNGNLLDLHKKKKDIDKKDIAALPIPQGSTTNNLFVGSTTELQRFLATQQKNIIDIEDRLIENGNSSN